MLTKRAARAHLATALLGATKGPGQRQPQPCFAPFGVREEGRVARKVDLLARKAI